MIHPCPLLFLSNTAVEIATTNQQSLRYLNQIRMVSLFSVIDFAGILEAMLWAFFHVLSTNAHDPHVVLTKV
jgi:hypothetical protein